MSRYTITAERLPYGSPVWEPTDLPTYRGGGRAWSPASLAGLIDYGVRNTGKMFIARDGTGANATATDDLVGTWDGQNGALSYRSTGDSLRPKLDALGVRFESAGSGARILEAQSGLNIASGSPMTIIIVEHIYAYDNDSAITFDLRTSTTTVIGRYAASTPTIQPFRHQGTGTNVPNPATWAGTNVYAAVYNGSAAWAWTNDTKTSMNLGGAGGTAIYSRFQNSNFPKDSTIKGWIVMDAAISDDDWTQVLAWSATL